MKIEITEILKEELNESIRIIKTITGFGSVNSVFEVNCFGGDYVIRINEEENRKLEFLKEKWCLEKAFDLGICVPKVLKIGTKGKYSFMIQNKVDGINGSKCNDEEKIKIWNDLGKYAFKYHQIERIEIPEIEANEFHKSWQGKLRYNINELNKEDSLLEKEILTAQEQQQIKKILSSIIDKTFKIGLVHGDLSPRNVIFNKQTVYLLDWGTAEINIVPHTEIGILIIEDEAKEFEFKSFLEGMKISRNKYETIAQEIKKLNLLHSLDKYRWADGFGVSNLNEYALKIRKTYERIA